MLQRRIRAILDERFQTWKPVTPADCEKVYPAGEGPIASKLRAAIAKVEKVELPNG